ncbi:tetratricopeptide repeat protein [Plesiomonas shigelloides subsp. oncorhynchi]|nr:tetratricopeptide repeat protein [Plesiomonas shigelloides]
MSNQTAALWQRYLQLYPNASAEAHSAYQTLQATLSNPAFQAKRRANQKMAANSQDYAQIEQELRRALQGYPNDPELLGELGRLRLRQSRHNEALALFEQAQKNDPSADDAAKWTALINTARYWGLIQTGDQALEKVNGRKPNKPIEQHCRLSRMTRMLALAWPIWPPNADKLLRPIAPTKRFSAASQIMTALYVSASICSWRKIHSKLKP